MARVAGRSCSTFFGVKAVDRTARRWRWSSPWRLNSGATCTAVAGDSPFATMSSGNDRGDSRRSVRDARLASHARTTGIGAGLVHRLRPPVLPGAALELRAPVAEERHRVDLGRSYLSVRHAGSLTDGAVNRRGERAWQHRPPVPGWAVEVLGVVVELAGRELQHQGVGLVEDRLHLVVGCVDGVDARIQLRPEDRRAQAAPHQAVHDPRQRLRVLEEPRCHPLDHHQVAVGPAGGVLGGPAAARPRPNRRGRRTPAPCAGRSSLEHPTTAPAAQDRGRRAEHAARAAGGWRPRIVGAYQPPELRGLPRVAEPRHRRDRVGHERATAPSKQRRQEPEQVDHPVPGVAHDGVQEDQPITRSGSAAASSVTRRPPMCGR